jgi:putative transcriptional regulator
MSDNDTMRYHHDPAHPARFTEEEEARLDAMSDEEVEAAARADRDNPPLTPERLARARRVVDVAELRRRLGLTQTEFARRYQLPVGTVRDWEQGRSMPDAPARALLRAIASEPELVERALSA